MLFLVIITFIIFLVAYLLKLKRDEIPQADLVPIQDIVVHNGFSPEVYMDKSWVEAPGLGIGFVWLEDKDKPPDLRPQTEEVSLTEPGIFDPLLILVTDQEIPALVTVLLDFQQIDFELDGQVGLLHEVTLVPGVDLEIPLRVNIENPGMHELMVLAFTDPYNSSLDPMYRMSESKMVGRRAIVFVGDKRESARQFPSALPGVPIPKDVSLGLGVSFASPPTRRQPHPADQQLYVGEGKAGELFPYRIWASNYQGEAGSDYAFVIFQDYHLVPVYGNDVTIIHLEPDEEAIIDTDIKLPRETGVSQMQIVYIFDPYKSILHDEVRAAFVLHSERIAIHVTE